MSDDRTLLLIGARGFVGRHVHEVARDAGLRVVAVDRDGMDGMGCDLLDPDSIAACIAEADPRLVINLAGAASVAKSWERPAEDFAINATGVLNLLEAVSRRAPSAHLVCASSAEVYGEPGEGQLPLTEDLAPAPVTPYGAAKASMEVLCGQHARGRDLRVAVIRAFNQIGPGQAPFFPVSGFARQIAAAEVAGEERVELAIGNLAASRDFTDVRDTARAFAEIARRELIGTFNLCSGRALKLEALVEEMSKATSLSVEVRPDPSLSRPVDPNVVYGSPTRLHEAIGWTPEIPLSRTVADLLDWWRAELRAA